MIVYCEIAAISTTRGVANKALKSSTRSVSPILSITTANAKVIQLPLVNHINAPGYKYPTIKARIIQIA